MATLSRTKKYQDLRNRLQQDTNADALSTNDLSRFQKRLNEIDSQNFHIQKMLPVILIMQNTQET